MFRSPVLSAVGGRRGWIALGLMVGMFSAGSARAQQQPAAAGQQPAGQAAAAPAARVFASDGGMVLNFIKADKTADFEAVIAKLKEGLQKSEKPERKEQATSWKVFKAQEPGPGGSVLYVFFIY